LLTPGSVVGDISDVDAVGIEELDVATNTASLCFSSADRGWPLNRKVPFGRPKIPAVYYSHETVL